MTLRSPRALMLLCAVVFAALTVAVLLRWSVAADAIVRDQTLALATPAVVAAMRVVNRFGDWKVLLPGTCLLFVFPRARRLWWVWLALMIVAPTTEWTLKILVGRPRPEHASMGFPSGHATAAAAYFGAVLYLAGAIARPALRAAVRTLAVVLIVLVAVARVVLRAHWPSDVVGGVVLGLALASAAAFIASARRA